MPSVTLLRPRGKQVWYAKWRMPNGKYKKKSLGTEDKKLALSIKRSIEENLLRLDYGLVAERDFTPATAWEEYKRLVSKNDVRLDKEKRAWDRFWAHCGKGSLKAVKRSDVSAWVKHLTDTGFLNSTINTNVGCVSLVFGHLIREEVYDGVNPFVGRKRLREEKKIRVIQWSVIEKMLADCSGEPVYFLVVLGALLGLRKAEILRARWEDINWNAETMAIRGTKTEASKDLLHLHPLLRRFLEPHKKEEGWIVDPQKAEATYLYRWDARYKWKQLAKKHGIPDARIHDLRHTFATRLLDLGYPLKDISKMLRHTSLQTTQLYADLRTVKVTLGDISSAGVV